MGAAAVGAAAWGACGQPPPSTGAGPHVAFAGVVASAQDAARVALTPRRCSALVPSGAAPLTPVAWRQERTSRRVAVISDLGDVNAASLTAVSEFLAAAASEPLDAVVLLGGNASSRDELQRLLYAVAAPAYLTVVVPGNRERVPEVRDVIASHAQRATLVDASVPVVVGDARARLTFVGGMPSAHQLQWPVDGCVYRADEVEAALRAGLAPPARMVAFAAAPVRSGEDGAEASDLGSSRVRVGDPQLAAALAPADLVVFGGALRGDGGAGTGEAVFDRAGARLLAVGSMQPGPRYDDAKQPIAATALLLTIDDHRARWLQWSVDRRQWEGRWSENHP